jgi:beta-glucosidase/6-phospho-beta-glucosidase/beta-galactosidase
VCLNFQYEGSAKEGGRGPSIWDTYTHRYPGLSLSLISLSLLNEKSYQTPIDILAFLVKTIYYEINQKFE